MPDKVCIQPCNGITNALGTVCRQASYAVCEDLRPEKTVLGCNPALFNDVEEDVYFIQEYPVIALEACPERCASKLVVAKGSKVAATVLVEDLLKGAGLTLGLDEPREKLGPAGERAVSAVAQAVAARVDELLR